METSSRGAFGGRVLELAETSTMFIYRGDSKTQSVPVVMYRFKLGVDSTDMRVGNAEVVQIKRSP